MYKRQGLAKQTTEEGIDDETLHTDTIFYGDRNLYIVGNQMPSYFVYMIVGGLGAVSYTHLDVYKRQRRPIVYFNTKNTLAITAAPHAKIAATPRH